MCPVHERRRKGPSLASVRQIARQRSTRKEIHVKVRSILITGAAFALAVPAVQAAASTKSLVHPMRVSSTEIRAMTIRGEALNRKYHLGVYAPAAGGISGFASDVANSNAVARYQADATVDRSDALSRYQTNVPGGEPTTQGFASDVANSDAVARYQANLGNDVTPVSSGDGGVFQSPAAAGGIAAGLVLLISAVGFTLARSRNRPVRPV
jgi:hypothetical protein